MDEYSVKGPLGSTERSCPINVQELFDELHVENSPQVESWRDDNIREWPQSIGRPCADAQLTGGGCT